MASKMSELDSRLTQILRFIHFEYLLKLKWLLQKKKKANILKTFSLILNEKKPQKTSISKLMYYFH